MVVEVMGRYAGWIALYAGVGGGADVILMPEFPYDIELVAERIGRGTRGARTSASWWSPRAQSRGGQVSVIEAAGWQAERLGGWQPVAGALEQLTGKETRTVVLGHLQRADRRRASTACWPHASAASAVDVSSRRAGLHGGVPSAGYRDGAYTRKSWDGRVPVDFDVVRTARAIGIGFGD